MPGKRRLLPRWAAFELTRAVTPLMAVERDGVQYLIPTYDRGVGRIAYMTGDYETALMADAVALAAKATGRPDILAGKLFVDVGAHIGTSAIPAVLRFGASRAIAFEPSADNFRILAANIALNDVGDRIDARRLGISDAAGIASLELSPSNCGDNRLRMATLPHDAADAFGEARWRTAEVAVSRLDDALADARVETGEIGLVWIDTQGHEGHVLAGAPKLLEARVPVICEYWPYGLRRAGGLEMFHALVGEAFSEVVDVRRGRNRGGARTLAAGRVAELEASYAGEAFTDLVLVP
jgi:FkbM family methyltransferase